MTGDVSTERERMIEEATRSVLGARGVERGQELMSIHEHGTEHWRDGALLIALAHYVAVQPTVSALYRGGCCP